MKFTFTVKTAGKNTATITAASAFDAGREYCQKYAPDYPLLMPARISYYDAAGHKVFRQEAYNDTMGIVLWIHEAF